MSDEQRTKSSERLALGPRHLALSTFRQFPLALAQVERVDFECFVPGPNAAALREIQQIADGVAGGSLYVYGARATGKSHLLQAACRTAGLAGRRAVYLPLLELKAHAPDLLEGFDSCDLVCIDDIHAIALMREWEQRLVWLYDRLRLVGKALLVASPGPPDQIGLGLPDLSSRLAWGGVYRLATLDDGGKQEALMRRAASRGLTLPEEVAAYLLKRASRDLNALMRLLDVLDRASLAAQRRLSLPLVKNILAADRAAG